MPLTWDEKINKNTAWGGDKSTFGRPVSGRRIEEWIKESLNKSFGYIYEDEENEKYLCFSDKSDYIKYTQTLDSSLILQEYHLPKSGIGYVYEDFDKGRFLGFIDEKRFK